MNILPNPILRDTLYPYPIAWVAYLGREGFYVEVVPAFMLVFNRVADPDPVLPEGSEPSSEPTSDSVLTPRSKILLNRAFLSIYIN